MISLILGRSLQSLSSIRRALLLVWESSRGWTIAALVLALLQSVVPPLILLLTGRMIDVITAAINNHDESRLSEILTLLVVVGIITLIDTILGTINSVVTEGQTQAVADHIMSVIHQRSILVDLEYYENPQFYNRLHQAQHEAPYRPPQIVTSLLQTLQTAFTLIGIMGLLLSINPWAPVVLLASSIPIALVKLSFTRILAEWRRRRAETERRALYLDMLMTYEQNAKEVRLFDIGKIFSTRFDAMRTELRQGQLRIVKRRARFEVVVQVVSVVALFGAFAFITMDALRGAITLGSLVIAFQAFQRGQGTFQSLLTSVARLYENNIFLKDFYEFLGLHARITSPPIPKPFPDPIREGIVFENVSFRYNSGSENVLDGVNLTIKPGEIIALVGENGAGKTTLIKLLCRLYDPSAGRITIDSIDLREFDVLELRRNIAVLFQDYNAYQMQAWENIWLGNTAAGDDLDPVIRAARQAGAHEVIEKYPEGYHTQLGNMFGGHELSIGQWQKVALARAFMRETQLIVLDEPTSSLDVMSEYEVFERFRQMVEGRSGILISHRLSTIHMAQRIYVLDQNRIAESGTHRELLALNGIYARLYTTQSKYYDEPSDSLT
ncbi:MAG: ABC transporter ATP-binding protein [Anaerolineae bacterium]